MIASSFLLLLCVGTVSVVGLSLVPFPQQRCILPPCAFPVDGLFGSTLRPPCEDQCRADSDCPGGICCPGCYCSTCQPLFPNPTPVPIDSCKLRRCPKGQVCVEDRIFCKKAPCPRRSRCVPISTKPGNCPQFRCLVPVNPTCSDSCRTDSDCKGSDKCCVDCTGCRTCLPAWGTGLTNTCDNVRCPEGETCVADPTPRCVCTRLQARCFVEPCRWAKCDHHPNAVCSNSYCGGCNAVWRENGEILTDCRRLSYRDLLLP